ncbi:MAG TPA: flagellar basal body-associated FliL family protein [Gemmobacter sp.]|nr:flagellar basal body-associated FliL family protein [Gemmobacter sp.]
MAEPETPQEAAPKRKSKLPLLIGVVLAILLGGGGFFVTYSGMILGGDTHTEAAHPEIKLPDIAFVPLEPIMISLGAAAENRRLRMVSQLEVANAHVAEVTLLMPRVLDVINTYLRAVEVRQLEDPAALTLIRSHLLRRIQLVTGEGRVNDLLITEFIVN